MKVLLRALSVSLCTTAGVFTAVQADEDERREHDAHVHGIGQFNVVVEGARVLMELRMPGMDVVGFEHEPTNQEQTDRIEAAKKTLRAAEKVVSLSPAAGCKVAEAKVEYTALEEEHEEHEEEEHEEHAKKEDHHSDAHHYEDHEDEEESHAEFHATYAFTCDAPDKVASVEVKVFELFTGAGKLDAQVVTPTGQKAQALTAGAATIGGLN